VESEVSEGRPETGEDPRVRLAGERTLLAWIRTGLAMMAFGFVVARFGLFLQELAPLHPNAAQPSGGLSLWFGTALIVLGVIANLLAARDHFLFLRRLDRGKPYRPPQWSLAVAVAVVLAAGGVVMAVYLIVLHR
jgi:putative membrane protein